MIPIEKAGTPALERRYIEVPDNVEVSLIGDKHIRVKGPKGTLERKFERVPTQITVADGKVEVFDYFVNRQTKALVGTITSHIRNMMLGVTRGYIAKLKIIYSHFPITVKVIGKEVEYTGLYGMRAKKRIPILGTATKVEVKGEDIICEGTSIEEVTQTAASIEQATRLRGKRAKDPRIFQDGIYVYEKNWV